MAYPNHFNCKIDYDRMIYEVERSHDYRLPSWQRPYVWGYEQRLALVQSFLERIPTGFIVLWKNEDEPYQNTPYVLDGQQRLTTMIRMLDPDETDPMFGLSLDVRDMTVGSGKTSDQHVRLADLRNMGILQETLMRPWLKEFTRPLCEFFDRLHETNLAIMTITGDEDYARTVYTRMNTGGIVHDPSQFRAPADVFTMANHVETMRATSA